MKLYCKKSNKDKTILDDTWKDFFLDRLDFGYDFYSIMKKNKLTEFITFIAKDFLEISLFVFGADRTISREKEGIGSWEREINLNIPVREFEVWNNNRDLLNKMLCFLSGDKWDISFRKLDFVLYPDIERRRMGLGTEKYTHINSICMLSGGLDSLIGAIDLLEFGERPLFVSIHSKGKTPSVQAEIQSILSEYYSHDIDNFMSFYVAAKNAVEDSMRTRSLMYFSHAIALATLFNKDINLVIPENGYISLNIPLTFSRIGSSSTRTTHPYYMHLLQTLLINVGLKVRLINPYSMYTKGEMIINCKNRELLAEKMCCTISCSHPDLGRYYKNGTNKQCGYCYPCTIRRAAIYCAGEIDSTTYLTYDYNLNNASQENLTSYYYAIRRKEKEHPCLTVQRSGPLPNITKINEYASLYTRGIDEMANFLHYLKNQ